MEGQHGQNCQFAQMQVARSPWATWARRSGDHGEEGRRIKCTSCIHQRFHDFGPCTVSPGNKSSCVVRTLFFHVVKNATSQAGAVGSDHDTETLGCLPKAKDRPTASDRQ